MRKSGAIQRQLSGIRVKATRVAVLVDVIEFDLFYDYTCPFVYRAAEMLDLVTSTRQRELRITWRYFSLAQVNAKDPAWSVWDASDQEPVRGRLAFKAAEAARKQGGFDRLHMSLLRARHRDGRDLDDIQVVEAVARDSGVDVERWRRDVADPSALDALARDHTSARAKHGVFGTPTFVFPDGAAAYVRLAGIPAPEDALRVFDQVMSVAAGERSILEIKRPVVPTT